MKNIARLLARAAHCVVPVLAFLFTLSASADNTNPTFGGANGEKVYDPTALGWTKVVDGFYQNATTYDASTDFYITSKEGLEFFRDFINGEIPWGYGGSTAVNYYPNNRSDNAFTGKAVHLIVDIDLENEACLPIGYTTYGPFYAANNAIKTDKYHFYGNFDAGVYDESNEYLRNHVVENLKVSLPEGYKNGGDNYAGFFGFNHTGNTKISNLTIHNASVSGYSRTGAVVGSLQNGAAIENCHVTGNLIINGNDYYAGGIVGYSSPSSIKNCVVDARGSISGWDAGGILGIQGSGANTAVQNCSVKGVQINSTYGGGGIVGCYGTGSQANISDCTVENVTITGANGDAYSGAVVGRPANTDNPTWVVDNTVRSVTVNGESSSRQAGTGANPTLIVGSNIEKDSDGKIIGGTFERVAESALAEGYVAMPNGDGTYGVAAAASTPSSVATVTVGGATPTGFDSLQAALRAASDVNLADNTEPQIVTLLGESGMVDLSNMDLTNVTLQGAKGNKITGGIGTTGSYDSNIFRNFKIVGINFEDASVNITVSHDLTGFTVQDCTFTGANGSAANLAAVNLAPASGCNFAYGQILIKGNVFTNISAGSNQNTAIRLSLGNAAFSGSITIEGNKVNGCAHNGLQLINATSATSISVTGNEFQDCNGSAVLNLSNTVADTFTISKNKILPKEGKVGIKNVAANASIDASANYWGGEAPANLPDGVTVTSYYNNADMAEAHLITLATPVARIGSTEYPSLAAAVVDAADGATITVIADDSDTSSITIADKSLTIVGEGATKPTIKNTFVIQQGAATVRTVTFRNLKLEPTTSGTTVIADKSSLVNGEPHSLVVDQCWFYLTANKKKAGSTSDSQTAVVAVFKNGNNENGSVITFTENTVETDSYTTANGTGYYTVAVSSAAADGTALTANGYSARKHVISDNQFLGRLDYAYVGGYAEFTGNTVDLAYYNGETRATQAFRAFQLRPGILSDTVAQLDVTVTGNTFKNLNEFFKLYSMDTAVMAELNFKDFVSLSITSDGDENANTFENIKKLGSADSSAAAFSMALAATYEDEDKPWTGIADPTLSVVLAKVKLSKEGQLSVSNMTLANGTKVITYTQPSGTHTGYYVDVDGTRFWYFASVGAKHYFVTNDGAFY